MPSIRLPVLVLLLVVAPAGASSLFDDDDTLDVEFAGPLAALAADVEERQRHSITLRLDGLEYEVEARVRGKSRTRVCDFPPLRLYFDENAVAETVFEGQLKLKLVTHCRDTDAAEANLLEELAAYRALAAITETSYRTRLLDIHYVETAPGEAPLIRRRYGFLIESRDELAARLGGEPLEVAGVTRSGIDPGQAALVYVFQYMIGNTDWSLVRNYDDDECCHNMDLIEVDGWTFPIPYDFDLAGIVDAPYAKPDPTLRIRGVRQRRYRGYCLPRPVLEAAIDRIAANRQDILDAAGSVPAAKRDVMHVVSYLDDFFGYLSNTDRLLARFERRCL